MRFSGNRCRLLGFRVFCPLCLPCSHRLYSFFCFNLRLFFCFLGFLLRLCLCLKSKDSISFLLRLYLRRCLCLFLNDLSFIYCLSFRHRLSFRLCLSFCLRLSSRLFLSFCLRLSFLLCLEPCLGFCTRLSFRHCLSFCLC